MKIGIMGAMLEEVAAIKSKLDITQVEIIGQREYIMGKLHDTDVVLVFSRWGKVAASSTATTLIAKYSVDCILFVGVAGALEKSLNVGDIVVGEYLYQHDMDATPLFEKHEIPLTATKLFKSNSQLVENVNYATTNFLNNLTDIFSATIREKFSLQQPKVVTGKVASGDQFVSHPQKISTLKDEMPDVLAVEMEGAAVAQICMEHNIPFIVIRIISDNAGHGAAIDFQSFIKEVSSQYSCGIIEEVFKLGFAEIN